MRQSTGYRFRKYEPYNEIISKGSRLIREKISGLHNIVDLSFKTCHTAFNNNKPMCNIPFVVGSVRLFADTKTDTK